MNLQDEIKALKRRISELEKQEEREREFPQYNDTYYYIRPNGRVDCFNWDEVNYDLEAQGIGNVFRTEEQAKFAVEKLKVEAELRKFSRPFERGGNNHSLFLEIYNNRHRLDIGVRNCYQAQGAIYFESVEKAQQAISTVGEDRIKKYIFGVED